MRKTAWLLILTLVLSLSTGCHPSNLVSESGGEGQPDATQNSIVPKETLPNVTLPSKPTLGANDSADPKLDAAILKAYCDLTDSNFLTEGSEMQVRHYTKIGDLYSVYVDGPWMYTQAIRNVTVYGCKFVFPNGQHMYLYRDGQICAVDDAETENFATKNEIRALWAVYQEKNGNRYGNGSVTE